MKFYIVKTPAVIGKAVRGFPYIELVSDNWDDYGYETYFTAYLFLSANRKIDLGALKILHNNNLVTRDVIPKKFENLKEGEFSLSVKVWDIIENLEN